MVKNNDVRALLALFGSLIVIEAWASIVTDTINYTAYSPLFEKIKEGEVIPTYSLIVSVTDTEDGKEYKVSVVRVNSESAAIAED